jgi:hypothetical protein
VLLFRHRMTRREASTWIIGVILVAFVGCSGETTGVARHIDVGDAAAGAPGGSRNSSGSGGAGTSSGGRIGSGGASGSPGGTTSGRTDASRGAGGVSGTDGGVPDASTPIACEGNPAAACPTDVCVFGCCGPGDPSQGCAGCCMPKICQNFDGASCPLDRCQLLPGCNGTLLCYPPFSGSPPSCGSVSYYGAAAPCCAGLMKRCGEPLSDGSCDQDAGGYMGIPMCLACGDGNCETAFENRCNCPEDCH